MKKEVTELLIDVSKLTQDIGRVIGSKKGHDQEGFEDLIDAITNVKSVIEIARDIEYNL